MSRVKFGVAEFAEGKTKIQGCLCLLSWIASLFQNLRLFEEAAWAKAPQSLRTVFLDFPAVHEQILRGAPFPAFPLASRMLTAKSAACFSNRAARLMVCSCVNAPDPGFLVNFLIFLYTVISSSQHFPSRCSMEHWHSESYWFCIKKENALPRM